MCAIERLDIFPPFRSKELQPEAKGGAKVNADSAAFVNFIYLKKLKIEDVDGSGGALLQCFVCLPLCWEKTPRSNWTVAKDLSIN